MPIRLPAGVSLDLPASSISTPSLGSTSPPRQLLIRGPLGTQSLDVPAPIILTSGDAELKVSVRNALEKKQRSLWGLTRSLINNAIVGVSSGYSLDLRLVGVGFRAAVEPIPEVFREMQQQMPRVIRPPRPGAPAYQPPPPSTQRLNMKLGYAHPVIIDIPSGITVTTPAPTQISLKGTDKQKLGLFAAKIRRWRKPEPYRGKVRQHPVHELTNRVFSLGMRLSSSRRSRRSDAGSIWLTLSRKWLFGSRCTPCPVVIENLTSGALIGDT